MTHTARVAPCSGFVVRLIALTLTTTLLHCGHPPPQFQGAGPVRDGGYFSCFRYHAPIGEVPLAVAGTYSFLFKGLPTETMSLVLYVSGHSSSNSDSIAHLSTLIEAEISDDAGKVICRASGSPQEYWTLMALPTLAAYWQTACGFQHFSRHMSYTLKLTIRQVDPQTPNVTLLAMLEGGGFDTP